MIKVQNILNDHLQLYYLHDMVQNMILLDMESMEEYLHHEYVLINID